METTQPNHPIRFAKPMMGEALQRFCSVVVYLQSANSYLSFFEILLSKTSTAVRGCRKAKRAKDWTLASRKDVANC
eukprot:scaffold4563_cov42-Cylindrotheca_fusiformis.AAC.1